ncbi:hypothetical protein HID58_087048, partial [Brassica napus]
DMIYGMEFSDSFECLHHSKEVMITGKPGRAGEVKVHVGYVAHISSLSDSIHTEDLNRVGVPFLEIES